METVGYSRKQERAAEKAFEQEQQKAVENVENSVIMDTRNVEGGADVHYITKIDIEKYRCITEDITSDEVIITDERIQHIEEHHPGHYAIVEPFLKDVLENPKYILEDAPNTGLLLKAVESEKINIKVVLRVHTSNDTDGFKNSIISAWHIRDKEYRRLIRNKKILYKQE